MIKSVQLRHFQSHKNSVLEFDPGVNAIQGSSNCGKSAILRGLNWVVSNRPTGESYISHWARNDKGNQVKDTSVSVTFDDCEVIRARGKEGNNYTLDGLVLDAIGTDVPDSVQKAIRFSDVNIQSQMDPLFLLSASGGDVARFFNKIVHLDLIDTFLSGIDSKKRKAKSEHESSIQSISYLEKELEKYSSLVRIEMLLDRMDAINVSCETLSNQKQTLGQEIVLYKKMAEYLDNSDGILDTASPLSATIDGLFESIDKRKEDASLFHSDMEAYAKQALILSSSIDMDKAETLVQKVTRYIPIVREDNELVLALQISLDVYTENGNIVELYPIDLAAYESLLPKTCPMCGKEI